MTSIAIRDGSGTTKYAQVSKGVGTEADPYFLQTVAPIDYGPHLLIPVSTNTQVLAINANRRGAQLENKGPDAIEYWIGTAAGVLGTGFTLNPGDLYVIDYRNLHTESIRATAVNGNSFLLVIEGV